MRARKLISIALLAAPLVGASGLALAELPGPDWMPIEEVRKGLLASGYSEITKLEAEENHWDGEGIKDGQKMKFDADPKTGAILGEAPE
ncbi:PepSY domain-containing protein [Methylobacterium sp. 10]|uniref:PepSY domain-containing protein n=1 Tax=Methylobacterium sp. 10 TaxID=1101191 RepID=UPI00047F29F1|nr:PepSY domain-containing protein [Methylobacterium sp. 10]